MVRVLLKKHFFSAFRYITINNVINMPSIIPLLAVGVNISIVENYPSILVFMKYKGGLIKAVFMIKYRFLIIKCFVVSIMFRWAPFNIFIAKH